MSDYCKKCDCKIYNSDSDFGDPSFNCSNFVCFKGIELVAPCPGQYLLSLEESGYTDFDKQIIEMRKTGWGDIADQIEALLLESGEKDRSLEDSRHLSELPKDSASSTIKEKQTLSGGNFTDKGAISSLGKHKNNGADCRKNNRQELYIGDAEQSGFGYFCNIDEIELVAPCPGQYLLSLEESGYTDFDKQITEMRKTGWGDIADQIEALLLETGEKDRLLEDSRHLSEPPKDSASSTIKEKQILQSKVLAKRLKNNQ